MIDRMQLFVVIACGVVVIGIGWALKDAEKRRAVTPSELVKVHRTLAFGEKGK